MSNLHFTVIVEVTDAYTDENAADATNALATYAPIAQSSGTGTLELVLSVAAPSLVAAITTVEGAVTSRAKMTPAAFEVARSGEHLARIS